MIGLGRKRASCRGRPARKGPAAWCAALHAVSCTAMLSASCVALPALLSLGCASSGGRAVPGDHGTLPAPGARDLGAIVDDLSRAAMLAPDEPYWPYRAAEVWLSADSLRLAEIQTRASLERDPAYAPALSLLSSIQYDAGRYAEGAARLEEARDALGGLPDELAAALALHYDALGDVEAAERLVASIDAPGPHWKETGPALTYVRLRGDRYREAGATARNAMIGDPENGANHNNYGVAQLYEGDPVGARDSFLSAIEIDPELPGPFYNLAIVERFYFFDEDAAARWYERYLERADEDPDGIAPFVGAAGEPGR